MKGDPTVEVVPGFRPRKSIACVLFDFDGTLSLIRRGWPEVMLEMFLELLPRKEGVPSESDRRMLLDDMMERDGRQTIHQMMRFSERVRERGGSPAQPLWYKHRYLRRLEARIRPRLERLERGDCRRDEYLLRGSRQLLEALRGIGVPLHLASGTDEHLVRREARLLDIDRYFDGRIHGARDDWRTFSKRMVIERILAERQMEGEALLSFGDGHVEIGETRRVGGLAVAVAGDEADNGSGRVDPWKRGRLLDAGADVVIADYRNVAALLDLLLDR